MASTSSYIRTTCGQCATLTQNEAWPYATRLHSLTKKPIDAEGAGGKRETAEVYESDRPVTSTIIPCLVVDDPADAIDFYVRAFDAEELFRMPAGLGATHAELRIGDSLLILAREDARPGMSGPRAPGGSGVTMVLYVVDVDAVFAAALAAGARAERPVDRFAHADRSGVLIDPFGHRWVVATILTDPAEPAMGERVEALRRGASAWARAIWRAPPPPALRRPAPE